MHTSLASPLMQGGPASSCSQLHTTTLLKPTSQTLPFSSTPKPIPCILTTPSATSKVSTTRGVTTVSNRPLRTSSSRGLAQQKPTQTGKGTGTQLQKRGPTSKPKQDFPALPKKLSKFYFNVTGFPFPIGPAFTRNTVRIEVERNSIWLFEQTQAVDAFQVHTPIRMTIIRLKSGGLWVHAPVAPTEECLALIKELGGPVEYVVLPTFAYEHKIFVGPFSRKFPKAKVYVTPYQWSLPLNLPPQFFGIFPAGELRSDDPDVPWADEIEQKLFLTPVLGITNFVRLSEVAFFHKRSRTLLVTDAVVYVDAKPPPSIPVEALLENARDNFLNRFVSGGKSASEIAAIAKPEPAEDTPENRSLGWIRMALLVLYFNPSDLLTPKESFAAISNRLIVGPVVETLVFSKVPKTVCDWVDSICDSWNFRQIIPCHFTAPIKAGPAEFKRAFTFAYELAEQSGLREPEPTPEPAANGLWGRIFGGNSSSVPRTRPVVFPEADMKLLTGLNNGLLTLGVVRRNADLPVS